jgi:hypothetical protein
MVCNLDRALILEQSPFFFSSARLVGVPAKMLSAALAEMLHKPLMNLCSRKKNMMKICSLEASKADALRLALTGCYALAIRS